MIYRTLGRTGLRVSAVGFGTEHLVGPEDAVVSIVREAIDHNINYFDFVVGETPEYHAHYGKAFRGLRDKVIVAGHLDVIAPDGIANDTCREGFDDLLKRLGVDYLDVCLLQFVDEEGLYERVVGPGGMLEFARKLRDEGKIRHIGMSSHMVPPALRAVRDGVIDVLMFPINPAFDSLPGYLGRIEELWERSAAGSEQVSQDRRELYLACESARVGLVGMKPFAAGLLFAPPVYGGATPLTPVQCLSYALAQPGVSCVVPGITTSEQLHAALYYLEATAEERDYASTVAGTKWSIEGECMYCNHCLPCPAGIDVAETVRLIDSAVQNGANGVRERYALLQTNASDCPECGECSARCPFQVDVTARMRRGVELFGR